MLEARANEDSYNSHYQSTGQLVIALNLISYWAILGRPDLAEREIEWALEAEPYRSEVHQAAGFFYAAQGEAEKAAAAFEQLTRMDPQNLVGWNGLRGAYAVLGEEEQAEAADARHQELVIEQTEQNAIRWSIPERFRLHTIFVILMMGIGFLFVTGNWLWVTARPEVKEWLKDPSSL